MGCCCHPGGVLAGRYDSGQVEEPGARRPATGRQSSMAAVDGVYPGHYAALSDRSSFLGRAAWAVQLLLEQDETCGSISGHASRRPLASVFFEPVGEGLRKESMPRTCNAGG